MAHRALGATPEAASDLRRSPSSGRISIEAFLPSCVAEGPNLTSRLRGPYFDHTLLGKNPYLGLFQAQVTAQDLHGVLTQHGGRFIGTVPVAELHGARRVAHVAERWMLVRSDHSPCLHLGVLEHFADVVDGCIGNVVLIEDRQPFRFGPGTEYLSENWIHILPIHHPGGVVIGERIVL